MRGNILFIKGLQPGRHPHATPTALSMDMMIKTEPPYPVLIRLSICAWADHVIAQGKRKEQHTECVEGDEIPVRKVESYNPSNAYTIEMLGSGL